MTFFAFLEMCQKVYFFWRYEKKERMKNNIRGKSRGKKERKAVLVPLACTHLPKYGMRAYHHRMSSTTRKIWFDEYLPPSLPPSTIQPAH